MASGTVLGLPLVEMPRTASGFTLIEMLLVVTVVILVASIALPSLRTMTDTYRVATASAAVASKVRQARTIAVKGKRQTWVIVNGAARSIQVQSASPGGPVDIDGPSLLPAGVTFGTGGATVRLTFDAKGRPLGTPQRIQVLYPGSDLIRTITVASTGLVTVH